MYPFNTPLTDENTADQQQSNPLPSTLFLQTPTTPDASNLITPVITQTISSQNSGQIFIERLQQELKALQAQYRDLFQESALLEQQMARIQKKMSDFSHQIQILNQEIIVRDAIIRNLRHELDVGKPRRRIIGGGKIPSPISISIPEIPDLSGSASSGHDILSGTHITQVTSPSLSHNGPQAQNARPGFYVPEFAQGTQHSTQSPSPAENLMPSNPGRPSTGQQIQKAGRWTDEEDQALRAAYEESTSNGQPPDWTTIAKSVGTRNSAQCAARWQESLNPSVRKARWTEEEDELLRKGIETYGLAWVKVATMIPGRTQRQARTRWLQIQSKLSPYNHGRDQGSSNSSTSGNNHSSIEGSDNSSVNE